jgi:hypothetical protein
MLMTMIMYEASVHPAFVHSLQNKNHEKRYIFSEYITINSPSVSCHTSVRRQLSCSSWRLEIKLGAVSRFTAFIQNIVKTG